MFCIILRLACFLYIFTVISAESQKNYESICAAQQTCSHCLQTPLCVWCSELRYTQNNGSLIRCIPRDKYEKEKEHWCSSEYVVADMASVEILENRPLHSSKGKDQIQVQPQKMRVRLRRGEEQVISLKYSKAEDYPVDLYYLMDLSASMEPYREQLSKLGDKLAEAMKHLTQNFRLGFGSFVDKVTLPMTHTQPDKLRAPCNLKNGSPCASPYGYKNQMPLTENLALFKSRVKDAPVSGNLDLPEGGFDAIMQAIVCTDKIGWREKARHLLVFSTDASYHIAGDGRLAGIVEPNDELCHLDKDGFYDYSLMQDYPSISQINRKAREHNINIIFAVTKSMNTTYHILSKRVSGSSIGLLENDAENVVTLVSQEYEKLVDSVIMADNASKLINVRYFSKCLNKNSISKEIRECDGLRVGNIIEFQIILKAVNCPKNSSEKRQVIEIGPRDLNESLQLDVEIICNCDCETDQKIVKESPICKGNGDQICGVCHCSNEYYGKQCECKGTDLGLHAFDSCRNNNESEICSGRGTCKCGVCDCTKRLNLQEEFYGIYCECDNFSCKRNGGLICSGKGSCECGTCNCIPGWTGETCDCKESNNTCMPPNETTIVCSGRGDCLCGSCHCYENENTRYTGQFCEECPTCPGQLCEELKDCVECLAYESGSLWQNNQCSGCPHKLKISKVKKIDNSPQVNKDNSIHVCRIPTADGCSMLFMYEIIKTQLEDKEKKYFRVTVLKEKECPAPVNVMGVALGVIIGTVIVGSLILLMWKLITVIQDRREYAKFEQEKALVRWERGDNPFYKKATTTFNNPTFKQNPRKPE